MDQEDRQLLVKTLEVAEENNRMLHKIRGVQKRQYVWGVLKVVIVIGIAFGLFYFLEPYFQKLTGMLSSFSGQTFDGTSLKDIIKNIK